MAEFAIRRLALAFQASLEIGNRSGLMHLIGFSHCPYTDLIGENFAFKFKGESLPKEVSYRVYRDAVRIFK